MKNTIYKLFKKLGYKIENQGKQYRRELKYLSEFYKGSKTKLLARAINFIRPLRNMYSELRIEDQDDGYNIFLNGLEFYVETYEEFLVAHEIFVSKDYNFVVPEKSIVFDIGGNIGLSALYFSQLEHVEKVISFEPVTPTFNQAIRNHASNTLLSNKIDAYNYGLSDTTQKANFLFNPNVKGNTGIRAEKSTSFVKEQSVALEVQLKEASSVLQKFIEENPHKKLVIKMDCEGGEYAILKNINKTQLIGKIDVIMMEYHDKGSLALEIILAENGFSYFNQSYTKTTGMLYAFK